MAIKETYDFAEKRAYHTALRTFIKQNLPSHLYALPVACFPAQEGLEVKRVYDALGWSRPLIIGIERDPTIAALGRRALPGATIETIDALKFFSETPMRFSVINVDFQGHLKEAERNIVKTIAQRHLLASGGILATNFYGGREPERTQELYMAVANAYHNVAHIINKFAEATGSKPHIAPGNQADNIREGRDGGITTMLIGCLRAKGSTSTVLEQIVERTKGMQEFVDRCQEAPRLSAKELLRYSVYFHTHIKCGLVRALKRYAAFQGWSDNEMHALVDFVEVESQSMPLIQQMARFQYRSGPATMHTDLFQLDERWEHWQYDGPRPVIDADGSVYVNGGHWGPVESRRFIRKYIRRILPISPVHYCPRKALSATPEEQTEAPPSLTLESLQELIADGADPRKLQQLFPDATNPTSWAALKAWQTRRSNASR